MRRRRAHPISSSPLRAPRRLELGGEEVRIAVRTSTRARRARIVVGGSGSVEVVLPSGAPDRLADDLIRANGAWIAGAIGRARERAARMPVLELERPGFVPLQGRWLSVVRRSGRRAAARVQDGRLVLSGPEHDAAAAVMRWYRREARDRIGASVTREARRLSVSPGAISIRDQCSRWGSCSPRGDLSFSWRLVLAPPAVLDYVVVHELCHLRRPDHSRAFWQLVDQALPGWREQADWLRAHGWELLAFAPTPLALGLHVQPPQVVTAVPQESRRPKRRRGKHV